MEEGAEGFVQGFLGGVAGDEPRAVLEARKVLSAGGSAADAATVMYFTLAVTLPSSASLGGGGVCLIYNAKQKTIEALQFLTRAPANISPTASRPSAVPGNPLGIFALHTRYGRFAWSELVAVSEKLARFGNQVSRAFLNELSPVAAALLQDPESRKNFLGPNGRLLQEGDFIRQADLANALSNIRANGPVDFYRGKYARFFVDAVNKAGGSLTLEDMKAYRPVWAKTISMPIGSFLNQNTAHFAPPPAAAGLVTGQMLGMLDNGSRFSSAGALERFHLLSETYLAGYADRGRWLGANQMSRFQPESLLAKPLLDRLMSNYTPTRHLSPNSFRPVPAPVPENPSATSFVVIDNRGMAVACSLTMNNSFGTGRIAPGTGVVLASAPGAAGRTPLSLGPMMVINENSNQIFFAGAASGGVTAATALSSVAARALFGGEDLRSAISAPRVHHSGTPDITYHEPRIGDQVTNYLGRLGHRLAATPRLGLVNAAYCPGGLPRHPDSCSVKADPRGSGLDAGATGPEE